MLNTTARILDAKRAVLALLLGRPPAPPGALSLVPPAEDGSLSLSSNGELSFLPTKTEAGINQPLTRERST